MLGYSRSRQDFIQKLAEKYVENPLYTVNENQMDDFENYNWCLTLPEEFADSRDFKAEEAIELDMDIELPTSYSLGKWIYKTNYQGSHGSCTANSTCHWVQILNVRKWGVKPTTRNIITPDRKDLWEKMGHNIKDINDSGDYVEKAVKVALSEGVYIEENGDLARFDGYATGEWSVNDESIEKMKRYLYKGCPIVWIIRGNKQTWKELTAWELKTRPTGATGGHAVALVGWDKRGMWFANSWRTNDWKGLKSRFFVTYANMKKIGGLFNYRYRVLYIKEDEKNSAEYLKRKNTQVMVLKALKKVYLEESSEGKKAIEQYSKTIRNLYPEINEELPVK